MNSGNLPDARRPVVFAPGIVSTGLYIRDIAMSKDGNEIYFCISDVAATAIFETKLVNNRWTTSGTPLHTIIKTKSMPGNGASAIYWVDVKIIEELRNRITGTTDTA